MDVTQLVLTWDGWPNGEKLVSICVQIWSRPKWAQAIASQRKCTQVFNLRLLATPKIKCSPWKGTIVQSDNKCEQNEYFGQNLKTSFIYGDTNASIYPDSHHYPPRNTWSYYPSIHKPWCTYCQRSPQNSRRTAWLTGPAVHRAAASVGQRM